MRGLNKAVCKRKYLWTIERDAILRERYRAGMKGCAAAIATTLGWPRWIITKRAAELGLARTKEPHWSRAQIVFLEQWAGVRSLVWMTRQSILRGRTLTAIAVKLKRLHFSRRIREGYTQRELELAFGCDHRVISRWIRQGWLIARRDHEAGRGKEPWRTSDKAIIAFVLNYPSAFRVDRVDQPWFMGLMRDAARRTSAAGVK